jgi:pilus assembly protein Flp/PilA
MFAMITSVLQNKKGQGMVEYGLILALVSIAAIGLLTTMGGSLQTQFQAVITAL